MDVPEAAMDKQHAVVLREYDVWGAGQPARVQAEPEASPVKPPTHD